jgi:LmbE family N-acetylglucosaminyl deacetylase
MSDSAVLPGFLRGAGPGAPPTLVLAAHPDDETVGAGGQLARLRSVVRIAHLTDGAPRDPQDARAAGFASREEYAAARRSELLCALAAAGVPPHAALALGYADQEASLHLAEASRRLAQVIARQRPRYLLAPAYEGGHPDHDAAAFVAGAARALAARDPGGPVVHVLEYPLYHAGPTGHWQLGFVPATTAELVVPLAPGEQEQKRRMLACFRTQQGVLARFPCDCERFRPAPAHDFRHPPHDGPLQYESFPWGMTWTRFRGLAETALAELGLASTEAA